MLPTVTLFGCRLHTYYLCAAAAALAGLILSCLSLRKRRVRWVWAVCLPLLTAAAALIGARLLNAAANPDAYKSFADVVSFRYTKLSLMGGLVCGVVTLVLYAALSGNDLGMIADCFTIPAAVGIVLLKVGCFCNGCCFGKPTDGPFGMVFPANASKYAFLRQLPLIKVLSDRVHPTQLYEIAGTLLSLAAALLLVRLLRLKPGSRAAIFAGLFASARLVVLPLRSLPYPDAVIKIVYPALYVLIILLSTGYLIWINRPGKAVRP